MDAKTDRVSGWHRAGTLIVNFGAGLFALGILYVLVDAYILR